MTNRKRNLCVFLLVPLSFVLMASSCSNNSEAARNERSISNDSQEVYQDVQPIPRYSRSQLRQNLIEITNAQANPTPTTSFFFNMGVADPIDFCPSIGFPIPSTMQLTNPDQYYGHSSGAVLALPEPTGVYTGDSTGTYVVCLDDRGQAYGDYWEGFIKTVSGVATWDYDQKRIVVEEVSGDFTSGLDE